MILIFGRCRMHAGKSLIVRVLGCGAALDEVGGIVCDILGGVQAVVLALMCWRSVEDRVELVVTALRQLFMASVNTMVV